MALAALATSAQEPTPPTPAPTDVPPVRSPGAPPIVRLPVGDEAVATEIPAPSPSPSAAPSTSGSAQLGWSDDLGLRTRVDSVRTNRSVPLRGAVPKVVRPQKRTFGGFMTGFANLFNPFAPTSQGVGATTEHWYDGRNNTAPVPRGFRDERNHEASGLLFSTPLGKEPEAEAEPPRRAAPLPLP